MASSGLYDAEWRALAPMPRLQSPTGRAISPITKTNWEGTGVTPDVDVPADQALLTAQLMALKKALPKMTEPGIKAAPPETAKPTAPKAPPAPKGKKDCKKPYFLDADGIRRVKPECI